jgi:hypothetical protein
MDINSLGNCIGELARGLSNCSKVKVSPFREVLPEKGFIENFDSLLGYSLLG